MKIKERRIKAQISQLQLAERLAVPQSTLATWEANVSNPRAEMLPKIADALGCTIDQLFGRGDADDVS